MGPGAASSSIGERVSTVGVDFDGVIHRYSRGWADGTIYDEPIDGAFAALRGIMAQHAVFVFTTRDVTQVAAWLSDHGFTTCVHVASPDAPKLTFWDRRGELLVTNLKLAAIAYIDDRAIRFTSWDQALADLAESSSK